MKNKLLNSTKIGLVLLATTLASGFASGAVYNVVASGNWSSAATWGGTAPHFTLGATDQVTISIGFTVTMDSTIIVNGLLAQVNVNGLLTSTTNSIILLSGTVAGSGAITANNIILSAGTTFSFSGSVIANTFTNSITSLSSAAQITANNSLTLNSVMDILTGGNLTMGSNSIIIVKVGSLSVNGGTLGLSSAYTVMYTYGSTTTGMELSGSGLQTVTINVPVSNSVALGSNVTLNDSLKMLSGSLMFNGYSLVLNGQVTGTGTFMGDANANLAINTVGGAAASIAFVSGYQMLDNFTVNVGSGKTVILASALTVGGGLTLTGGSVLTITGSAITLNGGLSGNGSFMVSNKSSLTINGNASIPAPISLGGSSLGNFILNAGANNTVILGRNMVVDTIYLQTGTLVLNNHNLSIDREIKASGSGNVFATSTSNVTINASNSPSGSLAFAIQGDTVNNLVVNVGAAGSITLGSDLVINGILDFVNGHVNTGSTNLQITSSGSITGATANSYVITGTSGYLTLDVTPSGISTFPVGTASYYSPASINFNTGSSAGPIGVNVSSGVYAQGTSGALLSTTQPMVNSIWLFQTGITSGLDVDMQLTWSPAVEVNGFTHTGDYISHYTSGAWDDIGDSLTASSVTGGMFSIQRNNITSMSPFAVFDKSTVTGIDEIMKNSVIIIYPNPVSENLYMKNNTANTGVLYADIFNVLGQVVASFTISDNEASIPVDMLTPGNYFVKFHNDKMIVVEKFIKM